MRTLIAVLFLISSVAFADQESEKGRLDDCFLDLREIGQEVNSHFGDPDQWKFNAKYDQKQKRCIDMKKTYVKKYGKYELPK
jgi:hypothetical protein